MFPTTWASTPEEYMSKGLALVRGWKDHGLVNMSLAPHAPYTVTDEQLTAIKNVEDEGALVQMHVHETPTEVTDALAKGELRPLARLKKFGLLNKRFLAVHMTAVNEDDIKMMAESGASVAHCPESNTKLASGFCPVYRMMEAGVNVCLGTDGAASNNDLDMFGEMRTAALLGKLEARNAAALDAATSLRMATINGAKALGVDHITGSLEAGKSADMIAVKISSIECTPFYNLASHLVYSVSRENVSDVWVNGRQLLRDRVLTTIDEADVIRKAHAWGVKIQATKQENLIL
jgi:5-methylthioadenosine/S-adenosylhomocysteine deaminase